jgi:hypothetical protein
MLSNGGLLSPATGIGPDLQALLLGLLLVGARK